MAWGQFVPYHKVKEAGNLSIGRLQEKEIWPGTYDLVSKSTESMNDEDWKNWDFVPDGLLVWQAWEKWYES